MKLPPTTQLILLFDKVQIPATDENINILRSYLKVFSYSNGLFKLSTSMLATFLYTNFKFYEKQDFKYNCEIINDFLTLNY